MRYWRIASPRGTHGWAIDDSQTPYTVVDNGLHVVTRRDRVSDPVTDVASFFGSGATMQEVALAPGEHHPRIHRPCGPRATDHYHREWMASVQAVRNLLAGLRNVFRYVEPSPSNMSAYGHEMRQLLIL